MALSFNPIVPPVIYLTRKPLETRGEVEAQATQLRRLRMFPKSVMFGTLDGDRTACISRNVLVSTGEPDIFTLRDGYKPNAAVSALLRVK